MKAFKTILVSLVLAGCFAACSEPPHPDAVAAQAAKTYYEMLAKGNYELFVDGTYRADSIPAGYREQLIANAKMFVAQQHDEHKGISRVDAVGARLDTACRVGDAFIELVYGDSLKERVVVPMICHNGVWYMR